MNAKHKPFTKYSLEEAYELLHLGNPIAWDIPFKPIEPSAFFHEELRRMDTDEVLQSTMKQLLRRTEKPERQAVAAVPGDEQIAKAKDSQIE